MPALVPDTQLHQKLSQYEPTRSRTLPPKEVDAQPKPGRHPIHPSWLEIIGEAPH